MKALWKIGLPTVLTVAACAGGLALATAALAATARADGTNSAYPGSALHASVSSTSGSNLTVTATGTNAQQYLGVGTTSDPAIGEFEVFVYLVEAGGPQCSDDEDTELGMVNYPTVTQIQIPPGHFSEGSSGSFSLNVVAQAPVGYSGALTVCAYSVWDFDTAAWATTTGTVKAAAAGSTKPTSTKPGGSGKPGAGKQPTGSGSHQPAVIARPRVTRQGHKLVCSHGRWSGKPTTYRYKWVVTREVGSPSLTSKLAITRKMHGRQAECQVTASNSRGRATATSSPVNIK